MPGQDEKLRQKRFYDMEPSLFSNIAIVSCGTMSPELNYLKKQGVLATSHIFYTSPGLHQYIPELEDQLIRQIKKAKDQKGDVQNKVHYADRPAGKMIDDNANTTHTAGRNVVRHLK